MARPRLRVSDPTPPPAPAGQIDGWQSAAAIKAQALEWLLPGRLIQGVLAILEGDTSVGKSTFLAGLAAAITAGAPFLGRTASAPASVLWLSAEEDPATMIRPRLVSAGADLSRVHFPAADPLAPDRRLTLPGSLHDLGEAIPALGVRLVIVEPLVSHISSGYDLHNDGDARQILDPTARLAMSTGASILITRGLRKDRSGPRTLHGSGSATIGDAARCIVVIDWPDRDQPRRVLRAVKVSGGVLAPAMSYRIEAGEHGPVMAGWRQLSAVEDASAEDVPDGVERDVRLDAETLLRSALAHGPIRATSIMRLGEDALISLGALRRAKKALGIISVRTGFGGDSYQEWAAPPGGLPPVGGGTPGEVAPMAPMEIPARKRREKPIGAIGATMSGGTPPSP